MNVLLDVVGDQSGKQYKMDHYATRYPTNVEDIAGFLVRAIGTVCFKSQDGLFNVDVCSLSLSLSLGHKKQLPPILHYSGDEPFTKYEMCLVFAKILGLSHDHIIPDTHPPTGADATTRPRDCHLSTKETEDLDIPGGLGLSLFNEWWSQRLGKQ